MANKRITELPAAGALAGTEPVEAVQGGINVQTTAQAIANLGSGLAAAHDASGDTFPTATAGKFYYLSDGAGGGGGNLDVNGLGTTYCPPGTILIYIDAVYGWKAII